MKMVATFQTKRSLWLKPFFNVLFAAVLFSNCVAAFASDRVALVIGNDKYDQAPLYNPVNDATAIANKLREMGYTTLLQIDADRYSMEAVIDVYSEMAAKAKFALFFYAGHAIQVEGKNYLIPVNATLESRRDLKKLIPLDDLTDEVGNASELGVVILDACRDNPFGSILNRTVGRSIATRGLTGASVGGNTLIAYATEEGAIAADGRGKHSPYTAGLLKHLTTPEVDVRLMFGDVRDSVMESTGGTQRPYVYGSIGGTRYFLNPKVSNSNSPPVVNPKISAADMNIVFKKFDNLRNAIRQKNQQTINSLARPSKGWESYLAYLFENFESIDVSLSDVTSSETDLSVQGRLTIDRLVKSNGDIGFPGESFRRITLESRLVDDQWSAIIW